MNAPDWKTIFDGELERAHAARAASNEGMARVCARRAAGAAIREYLRRRGAPVAATSVYDLCRALRALPGVPPGAIAAADHLLIRVDETHNLPPGVDLIAEAAQLPAGLGLEPLTAGPSPRPHTREAQP